MTVRRGMSTLVSGSLVVGVATVVLFAPGFTQKASAILPINQPTTITLSADRLVFSAGQSVTLTATTDVDVVLSLSTITIVDQTTGTTLTSCLHGTTCSVSTASGLVDHPDH
jgi:hypothetical protein